MRWSGLLLLLPLLLSACGGPAREPAPSPERTASGPLRTIARAPIPARVSHTAVWTGEEMIVWGGRGAPDDPRSYEKLLSDGAAYDPAKDTWRTIAASPLSARSEQNAVWTGGVLLIWGGYADGERLKDGAAYDPEKDAWTKLPDAPAGRFGARTAWTGTEALFIGGSRKDNVAYNPATRTWRSLPDAPFHSYDWALSTWTGKELLLFVETPGEHTLLGAAAYDPARDSWRRLPAGPVSGGSASGAVWTGDRAVLFSSVSQRSPGERARSLHPGGVYLPETDRWERLPLAPSESASRGTPLWTGEEIVQWGGTGPATAYRPSERAWRTIPLPDTPWREFPTTVWTGAEVIAWGGGSCPANARCVRLMPVEDGIALAPDRG